MHAYGYLQALGEQHAIRNELSIRDLKAPAAIVPAGTVLQLYIYSQHKYSDASPSQVSCSAMPGLTLPNVHGADRDMICAVRLCLSMLLTLLTDIIKFSDTCAQP